VQPVVQVVPARDRREHAADLAGLFGVVVRIDEFGFRPS
jgi:hypothetical protein